MRQKPALALWLLCAALPLAGYAEAPPVEVPAAEGATSSKPAGVLLQLMQQRLDLAPAVASAKYARTQPVDDPAREQALLASVADQGLALGLPPDWVRGFFAAQIEASKAVQRRCIAAWDAGTEPAPRDRADLAPIRAQIDSLNRQLVQTLAQLAPALSSADTARALQAQAAEQLNGRWIDAQIRLIAVAPLLAAPPAH